MSKKIYFVIQDHHDKAATIESFTERGLRKWMQQERKSSICAIKFLNLTHIPRDMEFIGNWDGLTLVIQGEIIDAQAVFGPAAANENREPGPSGSDSTSEPHQSDFDPMGPIKPKDVKVAPVPDEVIQVFNSLIQNHWDGKEARIDQGEVLLAICLAMGISKDEVFDKRLLDVEGVFRLAGWKVTYSKPLRGESYPAFFVFSKSD